MSDFIYKVNGVEYPVIIIHKCIKNIHYRLVDGTFKISCHPLTSKKKIMAGLEEFAPSLIKRSEKPKPLGEDFIYLYGVKVPLSESGVINFTDGSKLEYKNREDLNRKLRKMFLSLVTRRVEYYSKLMSLPLYKVSVRNMTSRFGSNSKYTKSVHFSTTLMHYSIPIIDSVIVHELAHIKEYNHSKAFYDVVYKYCPNYDICRKKLLRGEFQ